MTDFKCPACGKSDDKPVVLIGVAGTLEDNNIEAMQVHFDCLDNLLIYHGGNGAMAMALKELG